MSPTLSPSTLALRCVLAMTCALALACASSESESMTAAIDAIDGAVDGSTFDASTNGHDSSNAGAGPDTGLDPSSEDASHSDASHLDAAHSDASHSDASQLEEASVLDSSTGNGAVLDGGTRDGSVDGGGEVDAACACAASDECHLGACDPLTGACMSPAQQDGFACDDGDLTACTRADTCQAGVCTAGPLVTCPDGAHCRAGACVAARCMGELGLPGPAPMRVRTYPYAIVIADFDGDGEQDLATANVASDDVSVLLTRGNGAFALPIQYAVGAEPYMLVAGDFDADVDIDLAVANAQSDNVALLFNEGDGSFAAANMLATGAQPSSMAIADVNGDQDLDLVVGTSGDAELLVYINDGSGAFTSTSITLDAAAHDIELADMNGDGVNDIVIARSPGTGFQGFVDVRLNQGNGTFGAATSQALGSDGYALAIADFDHDGSQDVVVASRSAHSTRVFLNSGSGTLQTGMSYGLFGAFRVDDIEAADLDGDGFADLVASGSNNSGPGAAMVLRNLGDGTFGRDIAYSFGFSPQDVAVGDLNADGALDVVSAGYLADEVRVLLNAGNGGLVASVGLSSAYQMEVAEVDGDGELDLVIVDSGNDVTVRRGRGDGSFEPTLRYNLVPRARELAVADFNGDGRVDLAVAYTDVPSLGVLYNQGNTFAAAIEHPCGSAPTALTAGDFDHDGHADLVVADQRAGQRLVTVLRNRGNGTFGNAGSYDAGIVVSMVAADLNDDDWPDLVTVGETFSIRVMLNHGNGMFAAPVSYPLTNLAESVVVIDLNGDDAPDIAVTDRLGDRVHVLRNRGNGTFDPRASYAVADAPSAITAADLDGDTHVDLIVTLLDSDSIAVLRNNGPATFRPAQTYTSAHNPDDIVTADFNGDGRPDLVVSGRGGAFDGSIHLGACL